MADGIVVARIVSLLEQAAGSVPADRLAELAHADTRAAVADELDLAGRTLVVHTDGDRTVAYATGYADDISDRLARDGLGVLDPVDAAVVALVLLHTVAVPSAQGRPPVPWSSAGGVKKDRLHDVRDATLGKGTVDAAVSRLHTCRILHNNRGTNGISPGEALDRLTPAQRRLIEIRALALAAPDDPVVAGLVRELDPPDDGDRQDHT